MDNILYVEVLSIELLVTGHVISLATLLIFFGHRETKLVRHFTIQNTINMPRGTLVSNYFFISSYSIVLIIRPDNLFM